MELFWGGQRLLGMPRQPRALPPSATLHIISRGNRRQKIFEELPDYARFSASMVEEMAAAGIILLAFCLMPNHFHLLLQAAAGALSKVMHGVLTSHAAFMNKKYGRTGHLYGDRFKSKICDPEFGIKPRVRYIHNNPVKDGLVTRLEDWRWSSHHDYLNPASPNPSGKLEVLKLFGETSTNAIENYAEFMKPDPELIRARAGERFPLEKIAAMVERELGHVPGLLKQRSKQRDVTGARMMFVKLALDAGHSAKTVAAFLCVAEESVYRLKRAPPRRE